MNYKIFYFPLVVTSLKNIIDYIEFELDNSNAAANFQADLASKISGLKFMPYIFPMYDEEPLKSRGIQHFIAKNYRVFYEVDEQAKAVYILKICYAKQAPDNQMNGI